MPAKSRCKRARAIAKRKTETSSEVKRRWINANYKTYQVNLRYDTDQELIDRVEAEKVDRGTTEIFRDALKKYYTR